MTVHDELRKAPEIVSAAAGQERRSAGAGSEAPAARPRWGWHPKLPGIAALLLALGLFGASVSAIYGALYHHRPQDFMNAIDAIPRRDILIALGAVVVSYASLSLFDRVGLAQLGRPLALARTAPASFAAYAVGNTLGLSFLAGGALRARLYAAWGLSAEDIALLSVMSESTNWLGAASLFALACLIEPTALGSISGLPFPLFLLLGCVILLGIFGLFGATLAKRRTFRLGRQQLSLPGPGIFALQLFLGALDWSASAYALYVLLPASGAPGFAVLLPIYLGANFFGALSGVPGGLCVFEASILLLLPATHHHMTGVFAALLVYRLLYYILPLLAAGGLLTASEIALARGASSRVPQRVAEAVHATAPFVFGLLAFFAGTVLLASGAMPALTERLDFLEQNVPLFVVELSHFTASVIGVVVMVVAWGLVRRIDRAYYAALILLGGGIAFSLLKGFDYEEALLLTLVVMLLLPCRSAFTRHTGLARLRLSAGWFTAILGAVIGTAWLGFFSYRHVDYAQELWWQFLFRGDASRFLRAEAGVAIVVLLVTAWQMARPARPAAPCRDENERARALSVIGTAKTGGPCMWMSLLGDKHLLFSESGRSFLMYGVSGRSFVVFGEPAGLVEERRALLWQFRELCDEFEAWPAFYAVNAASLGDLAELGLTFQKIGEAAILDLSDFDLAGAARAGLRYTFRKLRKDGASVEIIPPERVKEVLPALRRISDEWLAIHKSREKGFSLGRFEPDYLLQLPVAIARYGGAIVAFANILSDAKGETLSVDLMRYGHSAPRSVMEYLFIEMMIWGKDQGYKAFDLGMAPLAGLDRQRHAPLATRIGAFVYTHGRAFYGFEGLRRFKDKFNPRWEPLYMAAPSQLFIPLLLGKVALLTSGGLMGLMTRSEG